MSKEMREQINKVKNWKQFLNESSNYFIIKKKEDDEYVSHNDIEFYDFEKIDNYNVDVNKKEDIERFVLSHIYYITQK